MTKKEWWSREITMEILVGAFMVVVLLGLAYFTIILSRESWFGERHEIRVRFVNVMGLREGDSVVVRGMPVGKVLDLRLVDNRVVVHASLEQRIQMHRGYSVTVVSTSMLGGRYLQINEGPENGEVLPWGMVYDGAPPYDLVADAAEMINAIKESLVKGGILSNLQEVAVQLKTTTTRINEGKGLAGKLLSSDETLYTNLVETTASLKSIAARIDKGEGTLGKLLSSDDRVYRDLAAAAESLKNVTAKLEKGEGLLGKLINDEGLFKDIESAVNEVRATVDDYRETAPIVSFSSVFFGAF